MDNATPFSTLIRSASQEQHTEAENSSFMGDMLGGRLGVQAYRRYTEQLWFVYQALEAHWDTLTRDPVAGPFLRLELARSAALAADLAHLGGADWRDDLRPLPATAEYAARVDELGLQWPAGYLAHHYTRYLGDLSGGQIIRRAAEQTWGFPRKGDGVRFYVFDRIGSPTAFKREYRALLDQVPIDDIEKQRVIDETKYAFALNTAVFGALAAEFPTSA